MRRYELMLVLRPDTPDDRAQALIDRTTKLIVGSGGQIVKVAPWGRRRLAFEIARYREGAYHILVFESTGEILVELERGLLITEDVLRHLVTRIERPVKAGARHEGDQADGDDEPVLPEPSDEEVDESEKIDESESEAAPAATD